MSTTDLIPTIPTNPEETACAIMELAWKQTKAMLEELLVLPLEALSFLKNAIATLEKVTYSSLINALVDFEKSLLDLCGMDAVLNATLDSNDGDTTWCDILWKCEMFMSLILNEDNRGILVNLIPFVPEEEKQLLATDYNVFVTWICKLSLGDILRGLMAIVNGQIWNQIQNFFDELEDLLNLDELIANYMNALESTGIFDLLDELDKYFECAFTICNFATEAINSKNDIYKKLSLRKSASGYYEFDLDNPLVAGVSEVEAIFNEKLDKIKTALTYRNDDDSCTKISDLFS